MTDTLAEDGNYLVRVRAQVMSRDDSSGGWVPHGGGGLSNVSVRKRVRPQPPPPTAAGQPPSTPAPRKPKHDYLILGRRISDNTVVLSCTIKKDFEYNKVMPTFHHWRTGDKRFGLTFQAAADARAFDKGVRTAVEDLLDGFTDTSPSSPLPKCTKDVGDDDVFMTLDLPQEPKDSRSSSDSSSGKGTEHLHRITYIGHDKPPLEPRPPTYEPNRGNENYSYVQLTAVHDYIYPPPPSTDLGDVKKHHLAGGGGGVLGATDINTTTAGQLGHQPPPALPSKNNSRGGKGRMGGGGIVVVEEVMARSPTDKRQQHRCRHCNEVFTATENRRGACEYAPDLADAAIDAVSCLACVRCAMYHCAADAEGDVPHHPCHCGNTAEDPSCAKRWLSLTLLAIIVPCLWFYPPLKMCHWCGVRCGLCGGRHKESDM